MRSSTPAIAAFSWSIVCGLGAGAGGGRRAHPDAPAMIIASATIAADVGEFGFIGRDSTRRKGSFECRQSGGHRCIPKERRAGCIGYIFLLSQ